MHVSLRNTSCNVAGSYSELTEYFNEGLSHSVEFILTDDKKAPESKAIFKRKLAWIGKQADDWILSSLHIVLE